MSKHKNCSIDCCHQMECCPRGIKEKIQNYRYMRWAVPELTFREYWWHEFKSLIGLNRAPKDDGDLPF